MGLAEKLALADQQQSSALVYREREILQCPAELGTLSEDSSTCIAAMAPTAACHSQWISRIPWRRAGYPEMQPDIWRTSPAPQDFFQELGETVKLKSSLFHVIS